MIYLDNNATTRLDPEVLEVMRPYFQEDFANPSSGHAFGANVRKQIEGAREKVATFLGVQDLNEITFTSGGTESVNTALFSALQAVPKKTHLLTSSIEHPAVTSFLDFCERRGYRATRIAVNAKGHVDLETYQEALQSDTAVASFMYANNETGVLFPIESMAKLAKEKDVFFHTDAVQAIGKVPVQLKESAVDYLSFSGHKMNGPKGIGVLYVKKGTPVFSYLMGGHQEGGRRSGTENVPGIIGLGKACELAAKRIASDKNRITMLRDRLEKALTNINACIQINGDQKLRLPNTSNISFEGLEGEKILFQLSEKNIYVSTGSACASGLREPSRVLRAMGLSASRALGAIRFSLDHHNTESEIDATVQEIKKILERSLAL